MNVSLPTKQEPAKSRGVPVLKFFAGLIIALVAIGYFVGNQDGAKSAGASQNTDATEPVESTPAPKAEVITISPSELYQKYATNEVATDNEFKGKIIQVTAQVESIDKDFTDSAVLKFSTGQMFQDFQAKLDDSQKPAAAKLKKGQTVTVQCESMTRIMDSPLGDNCMLK